MSVDRNDLAKWLVGEATPEDLLAVEAIRNQRGIIEKRALEASALQATKPSPEQPTLATLKNSFDKTANLLKHGITWETVQASLEADPEAIIILGVLIARRGEPIVTADENGQIMWDEACANVPLGDLKGIPMNKLAYDAAGQAKAPIDGGCCGNAVESAGKIHPRVQLVSTERAKKLIAAGLVKDAESFPWLATPDAERGNKNDQYAGLAWIGYRGRVRQDSARICNLRHGARFSLGVKKVDR